MIPEIIEITSTETLKIRHEAMWPNKPLEYVKLANDGDGRHFGLFVDKQIVAVISLFIVGKDAQFRKFATLTSFQGKGYGTLLLKKIMSIAINEKIDKIWCNARIDAAAFYGKFGMNLTTRKFEKGGIAYVIMEKNIQN